MRYKKPVTPATPASKPATTGRARPLSVSELSRRIVRLLEEGIGAVTVEGEVSNFRVPRSGHAYFVLKDSESSLNAVCFRSALVRCASALADGKKVEIHGRVTAYTTRSEYQIIVESAREAGLGELMRRFLELRDKLKAEGLFDAMLKRPLPVLPRTVGIVTSATGAALRDILNVLARRGASLDVIVSPCAVQGAAAPAEIIAALKRLERDGRSEVIILARGGGSIEDLWAFNEEPVVRAVAASKIPIICGVGHETDTTLCDYAADLRAPTPSAAAELVTANTLDFVQKLGAIGGQIDRAMLRQLRARRAALEAEIGSWGMRRPIERLAAALQRTDDLDSRLDRAALGLAQRFAARLREAAHRLERASPARRLESAKVQLSHLSSRLTALRPDIVWRPRLALARSEDDHLSRRLDQAMGRRLGEAKLRLAATRGKLATLGPDSVLKRGFSIITGKGGRRIITGPGQAKIGETLRVQAAGGEWKATPLPNEDELFDNIS